MQESVSYLTSSFEFLYLWQKMKCMKRICFVSIVSFVSLFAVGQTIRLTDYLIKPRLDSTYWQSDFDRLNASYSKLPTHCQNCIFNETDSTRSRFCLNTTLGHIQLDTTLHDFESRQLIGQWNVIDYGLFEVTDSLLPDSKVYYRRDTIMKEQKDAQGYISFTEDRIKTEFKNIEEIPNKSNRYKILDGKILTTRSVGRYCGATIIGITKDGFLIIDDHIYKTLAKKEKYLLIKSSIRRIILRKT